MYHFIFTETTCSPFFFLSLVLYLFLPSSPNLFSAAPYYRVSPRKTWINYAHCCMHRIWLSLVHSRYSIIHIELLNSLIPTGDLAREEITTYHMIYLQRVSTRSFSRKSWSFLTATMLMGNCESERERKIKARVGSNLTYAEVSDLNSSCHGW